MRRLPVVALWLFALVALSGCGSEPGMWVEEPPSAYATDGSMLEGTSMVIVPYLSNDAIEGGPELHPVDDIRSDDPSIVRLTFTTHLYDVQTGQPSRGVLVYAVHEGATNLRLFNGDSDVGTLPITVSKAGH